MRRSDRVVLVVAAAVAGLVACADWEVPESATFGLPDVAVANPSFARDVQPILTKRCALGGCHTARSAQGQLVLEPGAAYDQIVSHAASSPGSPPRVTPGSHLASWLWIRVQPDQSLRPGYPRMPLAAAPLTDNQITTIANWIDRGAQRN